MIYLIILEWTVGDEQLKWEGRQFINDEQYFIMEIGVILT